MIIEFNKNILNEGTNVLYFYAEWCNPCKSFSPVFSTVSESFPNIKFTKINVDDYSEIAKAKSIRTVPSIILIKEGVEVSRKAGALSQGALTTWLEAELNS